MQDQMEIQGENIAGFTIPVCSGCDDSQEGRDVINEGLRAGEIWLLMLPVTHLAWKNHPRKAPIKTQAGISQDFGLLGFFWFFLGAPHGLLSLHGWESVPDVQHLLLAARGAFSRGCFSLSQG